MKKLIPIILTLIFVLSLSACDNMSAENGYQNNSSKQDVNSAEIVSAQNSSEASQNSVVITSSDNKISREKAIEIALNHAGVKEAEVRDLEAELDFERGAYEWEVEFDKGNIDYSYDINAGTGEIIYSHSEQDR